jgi:hypothetical protein
MFAGIRGSLAMMTATLSIEDAVASSSATNSPYSDGKPRYFVLACQ